MKQLMMSLIAAALVPACGGNTGEDLIGTWGDPSFLTITFHDDGTFDSFEADDPNTPDGLRSGTWEVDGHQLTTMGLTVEAQRWTVGYIVEDDTLMFGALLPDGPTDGVIGTWRGQSSKDAETEDETLELDDGGTGHVTVTATNPFDAVDADLTWYLDEFNPDLIRLGWDNPDGSSSRGVRFAIPDVALGGLPLRRAEPAP